MINSTLLLELPILNKQVTVPTNNSLSALINPNIFLKSANSFTGKLFFNFPLITFEHKENLTTSINLTYNPLASKEQLNLGLGWGIPKNLIRFDSAINQYSIMMEGVEFLMNPQAQSSDSQTIPFTIANSNLIITKPTEAKFRVFKIGGYSQTYEKKTENCWLLTQDTMPDSSVLTYSYDIIQN